MLPRESWFHIPRAVNRPRVRLFCLPHAGGSATIFHRWSALLDEDVEVQAIQLPGRGIRLREPPYLRMGELVSALLDAVRPRVDVPYAIFGHSFGSPVGFELIRALRKGGAPLPSHFFVSGRAAPQVPRTDSPIHHLPQAEFLATLERRYGITSPLQRDPEIAAMAYPSIRADIEILETWTHEPGPPLPVPTTACGGVRDRSVSREALEAWGAQTSERFAVHMLEGDHFYLMDRPEPLLRIVRESLRGA